MYKEADFYDNGILVQHFYKSLEYYNPDNHKRNLLRKYSGLGKYNPCENGVKLYVAFLIIDQYI